MMNEAIWPSRYYKTSGTRYESSFFKKAKSLMENIIIVRLRYKSSEVEVNKLEVRTTMSDKIAKFGGTYGIWAQLTGCSFLGFVNLVLIVFKLIFRGRE